MTGSNSVHLVYIRKSLSSTLLPHSEHCNRISYANWSFLDREYNGGVTSERRGRTLVVRDSTPEGQSTRTRLYSGVITLAIVISFCRRFISHSQFIRKYKFTLQNNCCYIRASSNTKWYSFSFCFISCF